MRQLDVFQNDSPRTRRLFPLITVLQHHRAETGRDRVVAPMVPEERLPTDITGRLLPRVRVDGAGYAVLVPQIATIGTSALRRQVGTIDAYQSEVAAALDLLFFGI